MVTIKCIYEDIWLRKNNLIKYDIAIGPNSFLYQYIISIPVTDTYEDLERNHGTLHDPCSMWHTNNKEEKTEKYTDSFCLSLYSFERFE